MTDTIMGKARRIRGSGDYLLGRADRASVRAEREYQRTTTIPVLSGLHSRDPQRKARLAWLATLQWERHFASCPALAENRNGHKRMARRAWELLRRMPWVPVLP